MGSNCNRVMLCGHSVNRVTEISDLGKHRCMRTSALRTSTFHSATAAEVNFPQLLLRTPTATCKRWPAVAPDHENAGPAQGAASTLTATSSSCGPLPRARALAQEPLHGLWGRAGPFDRPPLDRCKLPWSLVSPTSHLFLGRGRRLGIIGMRLVIKWNTVILPLLAFLVQRLQRSNAGIATC
jgi:hypothetical protein